jgi:hypothetical protein
MKKLDGERIGTFRIPATKEASQGHPGIIGHRAGGFESVEELVEEGQFFEAEDGQATDVYSLASQEGDTECRFRVQAKTAK